jgi:hypothetical protein
VQRIIEQEVRRFTLESSKTGYQRGTGCPPITETCHDKARFIHIAQRDRHVRTGP